MRLFASSTFSAVTRFAATRWSAGPHGDGYQSSAWPNAALPMTDAMATAATETNQRALMSYLPRPSTPADEMSDLRRDTLRLVPKQQMAGALDDLERGAWNARREH